MTDGPSDASSGSTLGAALTAAREAAGMSVEQVSALTRIRATLVRDLEASRTESSGATVYARGHVRAIAAAVHTDPAPLVALLDAEYGRPSALEVLPSGGGQAAPLSGFGGNGFVRPAAGAARERRGPRWGLAVAVAAVVLVVATVVNLNAPKHATVSPQALPSRAVATPAPPPSVVHTPAPDSVAAVPPATGARLRVRLIGGSSWVSVRGSGATLFEGVLANGQFKDFTDATLLKIVVGNAGAVDLNCGGKDGGPAGGSGKVLRFTCTKDGLTPA